MFCPIVQAVSRPLSADTSSPAFNPVFSQNSAETRSCMHHHSIRRSDFFSFLHCFLLIPTQTGMLIPCTMHKPVDSSVNPGQRRSSQQRSKPHGQLTLRPFGRRITKTVTERPSSQTTYYLNNDSALMAETNMEGRSTETVKRLIHEIFRRFEQELALSPRMWKSPYWYSQKPVGDFAA
ncbi:MAG: hypothetical protein Q4A62_05405 [Eikenella sp.]|nr:hypothetical protein [Eikenella sp.]